MKLLLALALVAGAFATVPTTQCTLAQARACASAITPDCAAGVMPTRDPITCCATCKPAQRICTLTATDIAECAPGVMPTVDTTTGCPTCRPALLNPCDTTKLEACRMSYATLPDCAAGVMPQRESDCCLSCKPVPLCDSTKLDACMTAYTTNALTTCAADAVPEFDATTCCRSCMPPPPTGGVRPSPGAVCTLDMFKACVASTPVCTGEEMPIMDTTRCCPLCTRPERSSLCTLESVAACRASLSECAAGEMPTRVEGQCCPSCKPPMPVCTGCGTDEVCIWRRGAALGTSAPTPSCVARDTIRVTLRAIASNTRTRDFQNAATPEQLREMVREIVRAHCDTHPDECKAHMDSLEQIDVVRNAGSNTDLTLRVPNPMRMAGGTGGAGGAAGPGGVGRRLLQSASPTDVTKNALQDTIATEGLDAIIAGNIVPSAASAVAPSLLVAAAAVVLALRV